MSGKQENAVVIPGMLKSHASASLKAGGCITTRRPRHLLLEEPRVSHLSQLRRAGTSVCRTWGKLELHPVTVTHSPASQSGWWRRLQPRHRTTIRHLGRRWVRDHVLSQQQAPARRTIARPVPVAGNGGRCRLFTWPRSIRLDELYTAD